MTARDLAEGALHQLDASEGSAYVIGAALLDLADAVRELLEVPRPELRKLDTAFGPATVASYGSREPMSHERADRGTLETAWGPATVEGFRDRTIDGGVQRGEPVPDRQLDEDPRRIVHWDAGGDDSLACGQASGYSTRVPGDVTCVACSRIADLVAERDEARLLIRQVESQLDQWVVDNDWSARPDPVVRLEPLVGQLRTLYRVRGVEVARLPLIEVEA